LERVKRPWHRRRPALLAQVQSDVEAFCSTLHVFVEGEVVRVRGTFPVLHEGEVLARYAIEIEFPADYPDRLPIAREVGGRIPRTGKHHVFPATAACCVLLPEDRWWSFPPGRPFSEYLSGPLHNYFLGQSVVAAGGTWPFGEHAHGAKGVIAFYEEKFGTNDPKVVVRSLRALAAGKVRGHWPCPCESGKIIRQCHPGIIEAAKRVPPWAAQESLDGLIRMVEIAEASRVQAGNTAQEPPPER
jgi:hypothetical protein